ncbi:MAG: glycosyltransferase family 2 protein [Candidatus Omnitrophica bacterium]|nr:glycosyltransferase family 2 protein [Candidatus Omnitrophota bacterium]
MPTPVPLSVVVITKNEEGRLADCLESARWAAELIVVDDESTDRTVEIARRYTDRVVTRRMEIEGRHRNAAYALATQEWIFSLDADERFTPELREEITALLATAPPLNGYTVPRRNYLGRRWLRHGGQYPSRQLRLFRRGHFRYEEAEVHPRAFLDTETGSLDHDLMHYSYRDLGDFVGKLNRQTTLETKKWLRDGRPMGFRKGLWRTVDRFYRTYWSKQGRKDGMLGFIMAVLAGMYQFLTFAKYWTARFGPGRQASPPGDASRGPRPPAVGDGGPVRATITAVVLTKNEAAKIRRCLEAIRWVDEIILVDGESADGTPEIAREYGATVINHPFGGDFGEERNLGNAHATSDWILQLDADDLVTAAFRDAAGRILREGTPHAAFRFRRTNCFLGHWMRYGGWDHDSLHFFRRGKARYQGRVHHALLVDGSIGTLTAAIEHYPFDSLEQFLDRQNRYTTLEAQELVDLRGAFAPHELRRHIMMRPAKLFWKMYVKKQGFRDGGYGLIFSGLFSFVHFLKWAKVWELTSAVAEDYNDRHTPVGRPQEMTRGAS